MAVRLGGATPSATVTDPAGDVYTLAGKCPQPNDPHLDFLYFTAPASPVSQITVTGSSNTLSVRIAAAEVSGLGALDKFSCALGNGISADSGPMTPAAPGEFIFGVVSEADAVGVKPGAGFAALDSAGKLHTEWMLGSAAPVDATFTLAAPNLWAAMIATFLPAAPPPPPTIAVKLALTYDDGTAFAGKAQIVTITNNPDGTTSTQVAIEQAFDAAGVASAAAIALDPAKNYFVFVLDPVGKLLYQSPALIQAFDLSKLHSANLAATIFKSTGKLAVESYAVQ